MDRRLIYIAIAIIIAGAIYGVQSLPSAGEFKGTTAIGLTIIYEDGTERTFDSTKNPLSAFLPLQVSDSGGVISSLKVTVRVKPIFTGEYTSTSLKNSWLTMVIKTLTGGSNSYRSYSETSFAPTQFTSGSWSTIFSKTFTASSIQTASGTYGTYTMSINSGVYLTMGFGTTETTKSATASSNWGFKYEADPVIPTGSLSSISITIGTSALR